MTTKEDCRRLFEIYPTDNGWNVRERQEDGSWVFRGDVSPIQGRDRAIAILRRNYPHCVIRRRNA